MATAANQGPERAWGPSPVQLSGLPAGLGVLGRTGGPRDQPCTLTSAAPPLRVHDAQMWTEMNTGSDPNT